MADLWPQISYRSSLRAMSLVCKSENRICFFVRAQSLVRVLDPGIVARLGVEVDGALRAGSSGHLSEMCRLTSPSPACRRLVLGLVVALGLRCAVVLVGR